MTEQFVPFTRFGHSDGGAGVAAESAANIGLEFIPEKHHTLSFGAGWAKPSAKNSASDPQDKYVFETSYTWQLTPHLSFTPDLQLLLDPANNPDESSL